MLVQNLEEHHWTALAAAVRGGHCVLVVGPEVVEQRVGKRTLPVMEALGEHLLAQLPEDQRPAPNASFREICQRYRKFASRFGLSAEAAKFLGQKREVKQDALADIAALPFELIITTTPATELEQALAAKAVKKEPASAYYHFRGAVEADLEPWTVKQPLVYHLYGCVDDPDSLVLSESDLLDFLVAVIAKSPALPPTIRSEFKSPDRVFLFLGFGFKNWYLRILLHVLSDRNGNPKFALEHFESVDDEERERFTLFFREGHKVHFFDMPVEEFTAELRRRCGGAAAPQLAAGPPPGAPTLFLCHDDQDAAKAKRLSKKLTNAGFKTWLDKEQLRGGVKWEPLIPDLIQSREIDYFLVLQSANMRKREGYLFKEIRTALKRQEGLANDKLIFVVPLHIDGWKERLELLEGLQFIDLTADDGFERLMSTLRKDQQTLESLR